MGKINAFLSGFIARSQYGLQLVQLLQQSWHAFGNYRGAALAAIQRRLLIPAVGKISQVDLNAVIDNCLHGPSKLIYPLAQRLDRLGCKDKKLRRQVAG